jgi:hypothetical protein
MTNPIIPKIAYIPLEYTLSVDEFLERWDELGDIEEPTQKDYDRWCLENARVYFYGMRGEIKGSIRLRQDN